MTSYDEDIDTIPRKLSFIGSSPEGQMAAGAQLIVDYHPSSSSPIASQSINDDENNPKIFSIGKIYKNLIVVSVAFTFMLTAYTSVLSLQSSLNVKHNIGVNSLFIIYAGTIFSAIFFTGSMIDIFGPKWTMIIALFAYVLYMLANFYPIPALMYTSAGLLGLAAAPLWTAEALYVNRIGRYHAQHKRQLAETSVTLFFGIFSAFQGTSAIWGNLISYFVLNQSNNPQKVNCGIYFDPKTVKPMNHSGGGDDVDEATRYLLFGIFSGITILSIVILFLMLNQIQLAKKQTILQSMKKSIDVLLSLIQCKHIDQIFLIPITIWTLIQSTFLTAQFTRAFITCLIGIRYIGLVLLAHGITYMISSYIFGLLARYIGRIGCFMSAAFFNYAMIVWMYFWEPNDQQIIVLYTISAVWGISDAIWQSQLIAAYTILYSDSDPTTIAKYRLWKSVGSLLTYSYASYITISLTLFILTIFLTVSMICYGFVEIHVRWKNRGKEQYIPID